MPEINRSHGVVSEKTWSGEKDEVEDEISMKNEFQESGRKVMGSHKLGNTSFHRVEEYRGHQ